MFAKIDMVRNIITLDNLNISKTKHKNDHSKTVYHSLLPHNIDCPQSKLWL